MTDTWLTLQLARDAWDSGRLRESWQLMDRVEVDFEYEGRTSRAGFPKRVYRWSPRSIDLAKMRAIVRCEWIQPWFERLGTGIALGDPATGYFTVDRRACYDRVSFGDSVITGVDVERGVVTIGSNPDRVHVNPENYRRLVAASVPRRHGKRAGLIARTLASPVARHAWIDENRALEPAEFQYLERWAAARREVDRP